MWTWYGGLHFGWNGIILRGGFLGGAATEVAVAVWELLEVGGRCWSDLEIISIASTILWIQLHT